MVDAWSWWSVAGNAWMAVVMALVFAGAIPKEDFPSKPKPMMAQLYGSEGYNLFGFPISTETPKSPLLKWFKDILKDFQKLMGKRSNLSYEALLATNSVLWMCFWTCSSIFIACVLFCLHKQKKVSVWFRVFWMTGFVAGGASLLIWLQETLRWYPKSMESHFAIYTPVIWLGIVILAWKRAHQKYGRMHFSRSVVDGVLGAGCMLLIGYLGVFVLDQKLRASDAEVDRKWAAIGRPMTPFNDGRMERIENESLRLLVKDLEPFGVTSLYKDPNGGPTFKDGGVSFGGRYEKGMTEIIDLMTANSKFKGDVISLEGFKTDFLDENSDKFLRLYESVLSREPPRWGLTRSETFINARVPNFLLLRKLAQTFRSDATRRYAKGDLDGAKKAIQATDHLITDLKESPFLVSCMIAVAIDTLLAPVEIYFPPPGHEPIADEARRMRQSLSITLQMESWWTANFAQQEQNKNHFAVGHVLEWLQGVYGWRLFRLNQAKGSAAMADVVDLVSNPATLNEPDSGSARMDAIIDNHWMMPNITRALQRVNMTFVRKEQDEMIQQARQRYYDGQFEPKEIQSLVVPGMTWQVAIDGNAGSVSTKLISAPNWVIQSSVAPPEFFSILLDGSMHWKFAPKPRQ